MNEYESFEKAELKRAEINELQLNPNAFSHSPLISYSFGFPLYNILKIDI